MTSAIVDTPGWRLLPLKPAHAEMSRALITTSPRIRNKRLPYISPPFPISVENLPLPKPTDEFISGHAQRYGTCMRILARSIPMG